MAVAVMDVTAQPYLRPTDVIELGWYRMDPRGNKAGVHAQFIPPAERLAFDTVLPGEFLFPGVYADPAPPVVEVLRSGVGARALRGHLPDPRTEDELLATPRT